jgi:2-polyprenyl-6-methoxyphenol hydroxylase-like FAD-dependent oxidoreductase
MRVVIAGGGLVGLTLAGLLRRRGTEPVVLERMAPGGYVKRGFMLGHQGYGALEELGLLDEVLGRGRPFGAVPGGGSAAVAVEVGTLLQRLADGVQVRSGHTVSGLVRAPDGRVTGVTAQGPDGPSEIPADLVVACDGLRSRVRGMAGLEAELAPMEEGKIEWMSPVPTAEPFAMAYLSDGSHIGMLSWPEGSFGWRTMDRCGREAAVAPGIAALAESWARLLPAAADGVRALTSTDELLYTEPALLSCPRWWAPGVALIGDAAHFFGPETGVSAGIGLSDALALAQAIVTHPDDPDAACATYAAWREPAVRPLEAGDPSRRRLRGTPLPPPRPEERWPPATG